MGTPRIWYFPDGLNPYTGAPTIEQINLGENVTRLEEIPDVLVSDGESTAGWGFTAHHRSRLRVRISLERFTSDSLYRKFMALQSYLQRGGSIAFTRDVTKAWAGYSRQALQRGATTLYTGGNTWNMQSSAVTLADGDELWVQSDPVEGTWELVTVATHTSDEVLTIDDGLVYSYQTPRPLIRHRDFYPALRLAPGARGPIVTTDRRIAHTFDVELVENWLQLSGMSGFDANAVRTSTTSEQGVIPELAVSGTAIGITLGLGT